MADWLTLFFKYEKAISVPIKILPGFFSNIFIALFTSVSVDVASLSI